MRPTVPRIDECPRMLVQRERRWAIESLAAAYRRELELAEHFAQISQGERMSPEEVDEAIDARQFAEARLEEWSCAGADPR